MSRFVPCATSMLPSPGGRREYRIMLISEPPDPVWEDMPRVDFLRYAAAIRWSADQLGLRDWRLGLKWEHAEVDGSKDALARVEVLNEIRTANIWLCQDFNSLAETEQRRVICHELLHVHLDELAIIGNETIHDLCGKSVHNLLADEFHRKLEEIVESLAMNIWSFLDEVPQKFTDEDDVWIRTQSGEELRIGEYLGREHAS